VVHNRRRWTPACAGVTIHGPLALNLILGTWGMDYLGVRASDSQQTTLDPGLRRGDDSWAAGSQSDFGYMGHGLPWCSGKWLTTEDAGPRPAPG